MGSADQGAHASCQVCAHGSALHTSEHGEEPMPAPLHRNRHHFQELNPTAWERTPRAQLSISAAEFGGGTSREPTPGAGGWVS